MNELFDSIFSDADALPGKRPRAVGPPAEPVLEDWDARPRILKVHGQEIEFFTVGQLAMALGVKAGTIRSWEQKGWMPMPAFRTRPPEWAGLPNKTLKGRRLWTRKQVAGIVRIAQEEGMIGRPQTARRQVDETRFRDRVVALYEETTREIEEH